MKYLGLLCIAALQLPAAAQAPADAQHFSDRLAQARAAWQRADVASYVYSYNKFCECHAESPPETLVSVTGGVVMDVRHRMAKTGDVVAAAERNFAFYWTIDDLFDLLERAAGGTATVRADFDAELGVPQSIYIDYLPDRIGDEVDVRIIRFDAR